MHDFLNQAIFFRLFLGLAIGIIFDNMMPEYALWAWLPVLVGILSMLVYALPHAIGWRFRANWLFGVGVMCIMVGLGVVVSMHYRQHNSFPQAGEEGTFLVELVEKPITKPRSTMCKAAVLCSFDSVGMSSPTQGVVVAYLAVDSATKRLQRGDRLLVHAAFALPAPTGNPDAFDYGTYLQRKGIGGSAYVSNCQWQLVGHSSQRSLFALADDCRQYLLNVYTRLGITGDEFGMLAAITLGYKDALTSDLRESFSTTGAMHVLAVSGLHVGIIFFIISMLLKPLERRKRLRPLKSLISLLFLWFYAFITGLSPSVLRATLMFSLMALGGLFGRKSYTYNTVFVSAFLLLVFRPNLLFDVGFQLSYSAVLAIVFFQPKMVSLICVENRFLRYIIALLAVSLAAQIGTAPFAVYYFHQFPNYFWLSNFVVIPAAALILYTTVILFVVSWIPGVNIVVAFLLKWIIKVMYALIAGIEHLPLALSPMWIDGWQVLLLYAAVLFAIGYITTRRYVCLPLCVGALCVCCCIGLVHRWHAANLEQFTVFDSRRALVVNIIGDGRNDVFTDDSIETMRMCSDFWQHQCCIVPTVCCDTSSELAGFVFNDKRILVLRGKPFRYRTVDTPLVVDYLIVTADIYPAKRLFDDFVKARWLITTSDVSAWRNAQFAQMAAALGMQFWPIRHCGAFVVKRAVRSRCR